MRPSYTKVPVTIDHATLASRTVPCLAFLLVCVATSACNSSHIDADPAPISTPSPAPIRPPPAPTNPAPITLPPLESRYAIVPLTVPGYPEASVSLPLGATSKRPVVVAAHGNYDRPEWQCDVWRGIIGDRAFILCPRGIQRPDSPSAADIRFTYENNEELEKELDMGLFALAKAYPDYVDSGPVLYTGFSLGAIQGVTMAGRKPGRARRLVLVEGGHAAWKPDVVKNFAAMEGGRVLFVCSQPDCEKDAKWAVSRLQKANITTRIIKVKNVGHRYDGPVADATRNALAWILGGDNRFNAPTSP